MVINTENNGASYLDRDGNQTDKVHVTLKTVLLSDVLRTIAKNLTRPTEMLFKIDIEGSECNAFLGSPEVLVKQQSISIIAIIMEWIFNVWPERCSAENELKLKSLFISLSYIPFTFDDQNLVKLPIDKQWGRGVNNVLWTKENYINQTK